MNQFWAAVICLLSLSLIGCTTIENNASIELIVLDQQSQPIANAQATIKNQMSQRIIFVGQTSADGKLTTPIDIGVYEITVEKEGFESSTQQTSVSLNETKKVIVNLVANQPTFNFSCEITNPTQQNPVTKNATDSTPIEFSIKNEGSQPIEVNYRIQIFNSDKNYGFYEGNWPNGNITLNSNETKRLNQNASWENQPNGNYNVGIFWYDQEGNYTNISCGQKDSISIQSPVFSLCGNNYCDSTETAESCPQDCLTNFCPTDPSTKDNTTNQSLSIQPIISKENLAQLALSDSSKAEELTNQLLQEKSNQVGSLVIERKREMIKLAENNPSEFLRLAQLTKNDLKELNKISTGTIEEEKSITGFLEVMEKSHAHDSLEKEKTPHQEDGPAFDYFVVEGNKKTKITFADKTTPPAISGAQVKVSGVSLENYLVTTSATTRGFQVIKANTEPIIRTYKIGIVFTRAPNGTDGPEDHQVEKIMQDVNHYFYEVSYHQTTITWQLFGPYETEGEQPPQLYTLENISQGEIDLSEFDSIILVDERSCGACGTVGKIYVQSPNSPNCTENTNTCDRIGVVWEDPAAFNMANINVHELGHNLGMWHANRIRCLQSTVQESLYPEGNCYSEQYGDVFDVMGVGNLNANFNLPHQETIGWLRGDAIATINSSGTYDLFPMTSNSNPKAIKVPVKFDDSGQPTQYYYLEYRTPQGFGDVFSNSEIDEGVQIRKTGYESGDGGGGDTHQIDAHGIESKDTYPNHSAVSVGEAFNDSADGFSITVLEASDIKTTANIRIPSIQCTRNPITIIISPTTQITNVLTSETVHLNFSIKNNDSYNCSDRQIILQTDDINPNITGSTEYRPNISGSTEYPTKLLAGQSLNGTISIYNNDHHSQITTSFKIIDIQRGDEVTKTMQVTYVGNRVGEPLRDTHARAFLYSDDGLGIYVLDDKGKIHNDGATTNLYLNSPDFSNNNFPKAVSFTNSIAQHQLVIVDSTGQLYKAGMYSDKIFNEEINLKCTPASSVKIRGEPYDNPAILDKKGTLWWLGGAQGNRSYHYAQYCATTENSIDFITHEWTPIILDKSGNLQSCGDNNLPDGYLVFNQPVNLSGDRFMVAMDIDLDKGVYAVDSYGKVYTTGTAQNLGDHDYGRNMVRDIKLKPDKSGYGILLEDGQVIEYPTSTR